MLLALLVVAGLFHVTASISPVCHSAITDPIGKDSNDFFRLNLFIPSTGSYTQNTFRKSSLYRGSFVARIPLSSVIIQARAIDSSRIYGYFTTNPDMFVIETCFENEDSLVGSDLSPKRYNFEWASEFFTLGDIQFWVAVQLEAGQDYTWVEGPSYRAATDFDSNNNEHTGETTTHKIYFIVVPSVLFVMMVIMVVGSMMIFAKVKYGTVCCCSEWGTPISYRYARRYRVRQRQRRNDRESAVEQPPNYDNVIQEENKQARQNVAHHERASREDDDFVTSDDRVPLTGP